MNVAQTIFSKAKEAGTQLAELDLAGHPLDTKMLELFKAQEIDPLDYPVWKGYVLNRINLLHDQVTNDKGRLESLKNVKSASESAKAAAPAA